MNKRSILFALIGGLVAGLCSIPPASERFIAGHMIFMLLSTLPIFLAGLSGGVRSSILASLLATSISTSLNSINGLFFGLTLAFPAALLGGVAVMPINFWRQPGLLFSKSVRMSKMRTLFGKFSGDYIEVPSGSLLLISILTIGWTVLILGSFLMFHGKANPELELATLLRNALAETILIGSPESDQNLFDWVIKLLARFPSLFVLSWMICLTLNGILAQGLLMRFNYNLRTSPDIGNIALPGWFSVIGLVLLLVAVGSESEKLQIWLDDYLPKSVADPISAIIFYHGGLAQFPWVGYIARNLLLIQMLGFFFAGMGVMHYLSRKRPYRNLILSVYYTLALLVPWVMLVTNVIGFLEPWAKMRRRLA
ncbi:MAG: hypothetical protein ORN98_05470 [Alphaproteobacteria bacterium]|nr:hypothetical protein [Alphaproteobacteria bacterium]